MQEVAAAKAEVAAAKAEVTRLVNIVNAKEAELTQLRRDVRLAIDAAVEAGRNASKAQHMETKCAKNATRSRTFYGCPNKKKPGSDFCGVHKNETLRSF
jgi:hypothetical protein